MNKRKVRLSGQSFRVLRGKYGDSLICASSKCQKPLLEGEMIVINKTSKVRHYHEECFKELYFETRKN